MCGGQSISHRLAPATTEPSASKTSHPEYSPESILANAHGWNFADIESKAASSW
jgi:hypothetical protein